MARDEETRIAPEEIAQIRHAAQIIFALKGDLERRDKDLHSLLQRVLTMRSAENDVRQQDPSVQAALIWDAIEGKVEGLLTAQRESTAELRDLVLEVKRLAAVVGREPLVTEGFVVQANEAIRNLRTDVHDSPKLVANAVAVAVGAAVVDAVAQAVEVGVAAGVAAALRSVSAPVAPVSTEAAEALAIGEPIVIVDIGPTPPQAQRRRKAG